VSQQLVQAAALLHLAAAVLYAIASAGAVFALGKTRSGADRVSRLAGAAGLAVHVAGIAVLWVAVGHGPFVSRFENLSSYALATSALTLALVWRRPGFAPVRVVSYPVAFLLLGLGLYSGAGVSVLPPTFTGVWLVLHVCFYFLAFGTAVVSLGASVLILAGRARGRRASGGAFDAEQLDGLAYRYGGLAFAFWGIGMLTGAIWANNAWGRYWGWDPVESWSLLTWLVFGIYLHLRRFYAWKGARAAWLMVVCFALALISLFGTSLVTNSIHSVYFRS
jgi:cytochrome c-type biogenesis protein CcsB